MVATWEGAAREAYYVQQTRWGTAWAELTDALGQFQRATGTSATEYSAGETANAAAWG